MQAGTPHERRLPVVLQIVFSFENVVENAESAAQTHLSVATRVPGKTKARREVVFVWEIGSARSTGISGIHQAYRGVHKSLRLLPRRYKKQAALGVRFGCVVLITKTEGENQIFAEMPLILGEQERALAANIGGGRRLLAIGLRQS
jgi:hypothetical protein